MKYIQYLTLAILGSLVLTSCEPTADDNGDLLNGVHEQENWDGEGVATKNIKRVVEVDDEGDVFSNFYTYDNGRLSKVVVNTEDMTYQYDLVYNNNIMTDINTEVIQNMDTLKGNYKLSYTAGKLLKATGIVKSHGMVVNTITGEFKYTGSKLNNLKVIFKDVNNTTTTSIDQTMTYVADNMATAVLSTEFMGTTIVVNYASTDYDNYKNPYIGLPDSFKTFSAAFVEGSSGIRSLSRNNFKSIKATGVGQVVESKYVYTYDKDGFPKSGVASNSGNIAFEYY